MALHPTLEAVLDLFPPFLNKTFTAVHPGFRWAGGPRPFTLGLGALRSLSGLLTLGGWSYRLGRAPGGGWKPGADQGFLHPQGQERMGQEIGSDPTPSACE